MADIEQKQPAKVEAESSGGKSSSVDAQLAEGATRNMKPPKEPFWWNEHVEPGKPRWTYLAPPVIQAVVAVLGACFVLGATYFQIKASRETTEKQLAATELRSKIEQSEKQFTDVQTRLGSKDVKVRASAVLQLAELASTPKPGVSTVFTRFNYPFFSRAGTQLAVSLPIEEDAPVRAAILKGVERLMVFVKGKQQEKDKGDGEILLTELVNEFADANRSAKDKFIKAFAEWSVIQRERTTSNKPKETWAQIPDRILAFPVSVAAFCQEEKYTTSALRTLMAEQVNVDITSDVGTETKFNLARNFHHNKRLAMEPSDQVKDKALRLPTLETAAKSLTDTRDTLAITLRRLTTPTDFPKAKLVAVLGKIQTVQMMLDANPTAEQRTKAMKEIADESTDISAAVRDWKRKNNPYLSSCFLAGAYLGGAKLTGVYLDFATLTGVKLEVATLTGANLNFATLTGADLNRATLTGATFFDVPLTGAVLSHTDLTGAVLSGSDLTGAYLDSATLTGTDLNRATLKGAKVIASRLDLAKNIPASWEIADYRDYEGKEDVAFKKRVAAAVKIWEAAR